MLKSSVTYGILHLSFRRCPQYLLNFLCMDCLPTRTWRKKYIIIIIVTNTLTFQSTEH